MVGPSSGSSWQLLASSPGPSFHILSRSRGEKSGEGLGAKLRHGLEMVDSVVQTESPRYVLTESTISGL